MLIVACVALAVLCGSVLVRLIERIPERDPSLRVPVLAPLRCDGCERELGAPGHVLLGASTYPTAGDAASLVEAIGLKSTAFALVNDAVLAAWALSHAAQRTTGGRLVLTVGLGVGAAFEEPRP